MPYKKGGGNHLQYYDEKDGEYTDEERKNLNDKDKKALGLFYFFGFDYDDIIFHWPVENIHDSEFCDFFVKYSREYIKDKIIDNSKGIYLLSKNKSNDKSEFLNSLGYQISNYKHLLLDIMSNTDIKTLLFSRYEKGCLKCIAKTTLKGKKVTSVWELMKDFKLRFITLIPGGEKIWK